MAKHPETRPKFFGHLLRLLSVTVFLHFRPHPKVSRTDGSPPTRAKRTCWRNVQDVKDVGWRRCDKDFVENVPKKKELRMVQGTSSRLCLHKLHVLWSQTPHYLIIADLRISRSWHMTHTHTQELPKTLHNLAKTTCLNAWSSHLGSWKK